MPGDEIEVLKRRLEREHRARREAEAIAERVTGELYTAAGERERLNEELARANADLTATYDVMRDFVGIASHDLRGPITSILGFSALMADRWDDIPEANKREFVEAIRRQGGRMERLVEDLLTVSKIESGALTVHSEVVCLRDAVIQSIADFRQQSDDIEIMLKPEISVVVDRDHLNRIVGNYIGNALKYGAPPVKVDAVESESWVEIRVSDLGEGVPEDFVPRLFGRFARASTENAVPGTGLGLSIVQGLAVVNGGETWYERNKPHGSCFAVRLPRPA